MILLLGQSGFLGKNFFAALTHLQRPFLAPTRQELDLHDAKAVFQYLCSHPVDQIVLVAGPSGGIEFQKKFGVDLARQHLLIQENVLGAARELKISRLIFFSSSCLYPKNHNIPLSEADLGRGELEESSLPYALAKQAGVEAVHKARAQGLDWTVLIPSQVYGPHDHFDSLRGHVVPALMQKFAAVQESAGTVEILGDGLPVRDFLFVEDLVELSLKLLDQAGPLPALINLGWGLPVRIADLVQLIARTVGHRGGIRYLPLEIKGAPYKVLNIERARKLGLMPQVGLAHGLQKTWAYLARKSSQDLLRT